MAYAAHCYGHGRNCGPGPSGSLLTTLTVTGMFLISIYDVFTSFMHCLLDLASSLFFRLIASTTSGEKLPFNVLLAWNV